MRHLRRWGWGLVCGGALACSAGAAEITVRDAPNKEIPIHLEGFDGEVLEALRFDLEVLAFKIVPPTTAQYILKGSNAGSVRGQLMTADKVTLTNIAFSGGPPRVQAHALADTVIERLRGVRGIARSRIVFRYGKNSIAMADYDGSNPEVLFSSESLLASPVLRSGRLYYVSYERGNPQIVQQLLSTGARTVVAGFGGQNTSPAVSPDGRRLAAILSRKLSPDVWVGNADGTEMTQLTSTKEDESSPCWSHDGKWIFFISRQSGRPALYKVPAGGGAMVRVPITGAGLTITEPDCSPDGKWIVFTAMRGGSFEIHVVPSEGGEARFLTVGEDPCFAANSRTVLFTRGQGNFTLSLLDVPTGTVKDVRKLKGSCSNPGWVK